MITLVLAAILCISVVTVLPQQTTQALLIKQLETMHVRKPVVYKLK
jgi:hypothetical protein